MTEVGEIYLCEDCNNKIQVLEKGTGTLMCHDKPMTKIRKGWEGTDSQKYTYPPRARPSEL